MSEGTGTLFEREADLDRLREAIAAATAGDGRFVLVEGAPGIGKSRLLEAAGDEAAAGGADVLRARGGALEGDFAYGIVRQLLERRVRSGGPDSPLLEGPAELAAPALGLGGDVGMLAAEASFPVVNGLYWMLDTLAGERPVVLIVDDAHWADAASLRFLIYLASRLEGVPISLLAGMRPPDPTTETNLHRELRRQAEERTISPEPLTVGAVGEMTSSLLVAEEPAEEFTLACHDATGGNPFLINELLAALEADGVPPGKNAIDRVSRLGPETVSRSLLLRLAQLSASATDLVRATAVLGAAADIGDAAALAAVDDVTAAADADALVAVHVLSPGRPLTFVHPILREAVYADIAVGEREAMHARAAEVLRARGAEAEEIAPHLLVTRPAGDPRTVTSLREAAASALRQGAGDAARRQLERALIEPPSDEERAGILADLSFAVFLIGGDLPTVVAHLEEAVEATEPSPLRAELARFLARAILSTGDLPRAAGEMERELELMEGIEGEEVLRLAAEHGSMSVLQPSLIERDKAKLERFMEIPEPTPAERLHLSNLATCHWLDGSAADTIGAATRALGDGALVESESADAFPVYQCAYVLSYADEDELAWETMEATLEDSLARGSLFGFTGSCALRAMIAWRRGDVAGAEAEARNGIALIDFVPPIIRGMIFTSLTLALVARGELDEAESAITESGCGPYLPDLIHFIPAFHARACLRMAQGRTEEALADALEVGERDRRLDFDNPGVPWRSVAAEAQLVLGDAEEARRLAAEQLVEAKRWGAKSVIGAAMRSEGLVRGDEAEIEAAVAVLAESPARLEHALALIDLGAVRRRGGRPKDARDPLREGLDLARRCGATAVVERAHAELVAAGAKPRRLMFSGLESLTASERRVATMAAKGMTNREIAQSLFVTMKTIETHLGKVYSKLELSSRTELAGALAADEATEAV